jgi:hypothetical protein
VVVFSPSVPISVVLPLPPHADKIIREASATTVFQFSMNVYCMVPRRKLN